MTIFLYMEMESRHPIFKWLKLCKNNLFFMSLQYSWTINSFPCPLPCSVFFQCFSFYIQFWTLYQELYFSIMGVICLIWEF